MALSKDIYSAFEDVVGAEYICDDPVIMPSYHATEFAAIVLPENTAQVQAIVKLCNKHKLHIPAGVHRLDREVRTGRSLPRPADG